MHSTAHHYTLLLVLLLLSCWIGTSTAAPVETAEERQDGVGEGAKKRMEEEARPESRQEAMADEDDYLSRSFLPAMYLHQQSPSFHRRPSVVDLSGGRTLVNVPKGGYIDGEPMTAVDENGAVMVFQPPSSSSHTASAVQRQRNYPAAWDKRAQTFVRFGKRAQTFVRFGKRAQTFVRFG